MNNQEQVLNAVCALYGDFIDGNIVLEKDELTVRNEIKRQMGVNPVNINIYITITQFNNMTIIRRTSGL